MSRTHDISRARERLDAWYPPFAPLPAHAQTKTRAPQAPTVDTPPPWLTTAPQRPARRPGRNRTRNLAAAALTAIAAGAAAVIATNPAPTNPAPTSPAPTKPGNMNPDASSRPSTDQIPAAQRWCPSSNNGDTVTGNGPGGQHDGPSAILAFDYAYYALRSGEQARAVVAPDAATVSSAQVIQTAIDQAIPPGTEHCLTVVTDPVEVERHWVTLTERRPDSAQETYKQIVTTAVQGGRHVITSIGAAE